MKNNLKKVLSMICIFAMLLSCASVMGVQAANEELSIITAQFVPYEQEIRVLASVPTGYTDAKVYVNDVEIATAATTQADGDVLFTSTSFVPSAYGVATVRLEATVNGNVCSDTENIKVYKVTSKTEALTESFQGLEAIEMENASDNSVTSALTESAKVNFGQLLANTSNPNTHDAMISIANNYQGKTDDDKSLVVELPQTATASLPSVYVDPANLSSGIAEFTFDMLASKTGARVSLRVEATTGTYTYNSSMYPRMLNDKGASIHGGSYYVKHHDYSTYAFSDKKFETNTWHNVRFLMNFDELIYEYYVDDEKMDCGTIVGSADATAGYKRVLMQIGCSGENVAIAIDNISVNHIVPVAAPDAKEFNATPTDDFTSFVSQAEYGNFADASANASINSVTQQTNATSLPIKETIGDYTDAMSVYYKITNSSYSSNKNALFIQDNFDAVGSGRLILEHDIYIQKAGDIFNYCFISDSGQNVYPLRSGTIFNKGKIDVSKCEDTTQVTYSAGWNRVKIVMDFAKNCSEIYLNNNHIRTLDKMLVDSNGDAVAVSAINAIRLNYRVVANTKTVDTETRGFAIDNWRVYQELPVVSILDATSYNSSEIATDLIETSVLNSDAAKLEVALSDFEYCDTASLVENTKLYADGTEVENEITFENGKLSADLVGVPAHSDVQFVIDKNVAFKGSTHIIGADTVLNLKKANDDDMYIKRTVGVSDSFIQAKCNLDVVSDSKKVVVVLASYDGDELVGITSRTETLSGPDTLSLKLPVDVSDKAKIFVLNNIDTNVTPYETELEYSIPSQN